jgi:phosphopantothenoylcysteine decarboxylase/phosphopantothenate--cysteine ligase
VRILVTAGPTREAIDPVRFVSNRSSGRMGYAVAEAAGARGHEVTLISGPVALRGPVGVLRVDVESAADMEAAVGSRFEACDALVMAAAVADWRPKHRSGVKLKKGAGPAVLEMERTTDILAGLRDRKGGRIVVGFAAETGDPVPEARRKLIEKGLDLVVANDVLEPGAGFEVETNRVTLVSREAVEALPLMTKRELANRLIAWVENAARGAR